VATRTEDATTIDLAVEGMTCGSCAARVQRVLAKTEGVADAEVNFATGRAQVTVDRPVPAADLQARVDRIGYGLTPVAEAPRGGDEGACLGGILQAPKHLKCLVTRESSSVALVASTQILDGGIPLPGIESSGSHDPRRP